MIYGLWMGSPAVSALPTVVVVDDAAEVRLLVRTHLSLSGLFEVVAEGANGREAVDLAGRHQPTLLVLDVSMPLMDGLEALPLIRSVAPDTQVVLYTGFDESGLADRARELGAAALIEKSMMVDELPAQLAAVIGHSTSTAHAAPADDADSTAEPQHASTNVLTEHLERFREVFEEAAIGMATMTLAGRIVRANKALAELVGVQAHALVGQQYADIAADDDRSGVVDALQRAQAGSGEVVRAEHRVTGSGSPRWLLTTVAPVKDSQGRPLYLFLQSQDVTAQRSAEEELRQSEVRFRLLVEAVQDYAIFMLDTEGRVLSWNLGAQRIKGYTADEIIGQHFRTFYPEHMQAIRHPERELELALRDGHYEEEGWRIRKDGSRFWANVLITTVRDGSGRHIGFAKVTRNTEERRQMLLDLEAAAQALAATNRDLEAANARLAQDAADQAQFLAVTAHELRTPVSVLSGSANLLVEHWDRMEPQDRDDLLQSINSSGKRLQRLLRDLLTASRLESKSLEFHTHPVEVAPLLEAAIAAARAASPGVDIVLDVEPDLLLIAEQDRVAQAVDNLLGNAIRHGAPPVTVTARRHGERVEISISDAGAGIPEHVRDRLFQRFVTGSPSGGTGLGLFIVRELARGQGGDAWYAPADDAGTARFVLSLPAGSHGSASSVQ